MRLQTKLGEFQEDLAWTLVHEGGISNHPADPGRFTFKGIAEAKHADKTEFWKRVRYLKAQGVTDQKLLADIELNRYVGDIYWKDYYEPLGCPEMKTPTLRRKVFDTAVNVGRRRCARWIQRTLNLCDRGSEKVGLVLDGGIGPATLKVLNGYAKEDEFLTKQVTGFQMSHYQGISEKTSRFEVFIRGWTNRAFEGVLGKMSAMDHALADIVTDEDVEASLITGDKVGQSLAPAWG